MRKFTGMRLNKTTAQMQLCMSVKTQEKRQTKNEHI